MKQDTRPSPQYFPPSKKAFLWKIILLYAFYITFTIFPNFEKMGFLLEKTLNFGRQKAFYEIFPIYPLSTSNLVFSKYFKKYHFVFQKIQLLFRNKTLFSYVFKKLYYFIHLLRRLCYNKSERISKFSNSNSSDWQVNVKKTPAARE